MHRSVTFLVSASLAALWGASTAVAQDITTGLIAHWKMDEAIGATTATDSAGANNGTVGTAVTTGLPGRVNNGYTFPGTATATNRVLTTATAGNLSLNTGPFSMFAFIKTPAIGAVQRHIFSGNDGAANRWNLGVSAASPGNLFWFHNGGLNEVSTNLKVDDDVFHLVGVSKDASNAYTAYVDNNTFSLGTDAVVLSNAVIALGNRPNANTFPFLGTLDDMRIYNRVLSSLDIQALLNQPVPPPADTQWIANASSSWHIAGNWSGAIPNSSTSAVLLGGVITAPRTIAVDAPVSLKRLSFDNSVANYVVGGTSNFTFDADSGNAQLKGLTGSHRMQVAVELADNLDADIAAGATVSFDNALRLNGKTLAKTGAGTLNVNNLLHSATGTVNVSAGTLGGNGEIGGALNNQSGGTVAPGTSVGTLGVAGNYIQSAGAKLQIELAGAGTEQFDILDIDGTANLAGTLDVALLGGFTPSNGQSFTVLTASSVTNSGLTLGGSSAGFTLNFTPTSVSLSFSGSLAGDFNHDNKVDAADYVVWRKTDGSVAGFNTWRSNFGKTAGNGSALGQAAVPEPTAAMLFGLAAVLLQTIRRR
jgi:hypothetical protein